MRALSGTFASLGLLALLAAPATPLLAGCDSTPLECNSGVEFEAVDTTPDSVTTFGATIQRSDCVVLDYEGRVPGAAEPFDSGTNAAFFISRTVPGFQLGVVGRKTGQSVRITVPPELGYNTQDRSASGIPRCSTLEFDVTIKDTASPSVCGR